MQYSRSITLRDGRSCTLRHGVAADGEAVLRSFIQLRTQTDFLLAYADEIRFTAKQEAQLLQAKADSPDEVLLIAEVDGAIAGTAGVDALGRRDKVRHRATFGISLDQAYWGLGIGTALTAACIECARQAGYEQLELEVVEDNVRAISLYRRAGFVEYGCNPLGLRPRTGGYQALLAMRLELSGPSPLPPPNH